MDNQTPGIRQELSSASGRRIWMVTIGIAVLLLVVMLAFVVIRKYVPPPPVSPVAPKTQPLQP